MIIVSALSIYLAIGALCMIFSLAIARKHGGAISVDVMIAGIVVWIFVFPELFRLIWTTIKLSYHEQKVKKMEQNIENMQHEMEKLMREYEDR